MSPEVVDPVGRPLYGVTVPLLVTEDLRQSQTGDSDQDQGPQVEMNLCLRFNALSSNESPGTWKNIIN